MNKNMIINGINNESATLYEELLNYGFEDVIFIDSDIEKGRRIQSLIDSKPSEYLGILEEISSRIGLGNKLEVI